MKIQIIGFSGSGKSTLARTLAKHYNVPSLHLDNTRFYGDWEERTSEEQSIIVENFLNENDSWVIDGNYSSVTPRRFNESELTIFLKYNRLVCYRNCKTRYIKYKGRNREDCPCTEKFDLEFKKWILWTGRKSKRVKKMMNNLKSTKGDKLIFKKRRQLHNWLKHKDIHFEGA